MVNTLRHSNLLPVILSCVEIVYVTKFEYHPFKQDTFQTHWLKICNYFMPFLSDILFNIMVHFTGVSSRLRMAVPVTLAFASDCMCGLRSGGVESRSGLLKLDLSFYLNDCMPLYNCRKVFVQFSRI